MLSRPPPALQTAPDSFATRPNGPPPMLRAPLPSQRPTMVAQYMVIGLNTSYASQLTESSLCESNVLIL